MADNRSDDRFDDRSDHRSDNGVAKSAPNRKKKATKSETTTKKGLKLNTAVKELAASEAKVELMRSELEKARETILSLQATLRSSGNNAVDVSNTESGSDIGPLSTRHSGTSAGLKVPGNGAAEVDSVEFGSDIGPSSTRRSGRGATIFRAPESTAMEIDNVESGTTGPSSTHRSGGGEATMEVSRFMSSVNQISISTINIPECKPSVEGEEIGKFEFESWKDLLVDSMTLAGVTDEPTQFIVFKVKAGPKLMEIYRNTTTTTDCPNRDAFPFTNAMHRLKTYFGSSSDIMLQRRKLAMMTQKPDESDVSFIMRVGAIARMCDYGIEKELEEIASTVAEHARTREVRTTALRMLSRKGTLNELIDKVREIQAVNMNEEYYRIRHGTGEPATVASVNVSQGRTSKQDYARGPGSCGRSGNSLSRRWDELGPRRPSTSGWKKPGGERCFRCNSMFHRPTDCFAIDKTCLKCGRKGHFKRACKLLIRTGSKRLNEGEDSGIEVKRIAMVDMEEHTKEEERPIDVEIAEKHSLPCFGVSNLLSENSDDCGNELQVPD
ncbi:hypothetical protein RP20_CCG013712 [Aedes albopictus]|nr:hypothetical protein RP20_CCG013712 [Aedes albopictus]